MDYAPMSAAERTFATPELLEHILTYLVDQLLPITDREDPRSVRVNENARILLHLLRCTQVHSNWSQCIIGSKRFQRALFFIQDNNTLRSWSLGGRPPTFREQQPGIHTVPKLRAPQLNPIIQTTFAAYHFRFWHLSPEVTGNKHCAYLIIKRRDIPAVRLRALTGQGRSISTMLLSQPPCTDLEATVWEERDHSQTMDYVGRTHAPAEPIIRCDTGVTIGMVHERVSKMFDDYPDVLAIKLTTM